MTERGGAIIFVGFRRPAPPPHLTMPQYYLNDREGGRLYLL